MNYNKLQSYELSNVDIKKILGKNINIIPYPQLNNYSSLQSCMRNNDMFVLFFETTNSTTGHWQCMFNNGTYNFWDSYGLKPSGDKSYIQKNILIQLKEIQPYLPNLLNTGLKNGLNIIYNKNDYQSWSGDVSTCGRHVCTRLLNKHMNEQEYYNYLSAYQAKYNLKSFDDVVINFIYNIIHK